MSGAEFGLSLFDEMNSRALGVEIKMVRKASNRRIRGSCGLRCSAIKKESASDGDEFTFQLRGS